MIVKRGVTRERPVPTDDPAWGGASGEVSPSAHCFLREHGAFPVRLVRTRAAARGRLQLLDALLHRDSFLVRESLELLVVRGGVLAGLLHVLLWAHRNLLILTCVGNLATVRVRTRAI